jgi:hypothetical protein
MGIRMCPIDSTHKQLCLHTILERNILLKLEHRSFYKFSFRIQYTYKSGAIIVSKFCPHLWTTKFFPNVIKPNLLTGVDVMITIFCDFRQFSAQKLAFFSRTNVMIIFANISSSLSKKRQFFRQFFGENILKIITSVPG